MAASDELRYSSATTSSTNATSSLASSSDNQLKSNTKLNEDLTSSLLYLTNSTAATNEANLLNGNFFMQSLVNHHHHHHHPTHQDIHQSQLFNLAYQHIGQEQTNNNQNDLSVPSSPNSSVDSPASSSSGHLSNVNSQQLSN